MYFSNVYLFIFIYLKGGVRVRERERSTYLLSPQMLPTAMVAPCQRQDPKTPFESPMWLEDIPVLVPLFTGNNIYWKANKGLDPRHSDMRRRHPKWYCTILPAPHFFNFVFLSFKSSFYILDTVFYQMYPLQKNFLSLWLDFLFSLDREQKF